MKKIILMAIFAMAACAANAQTNGVFTQKRWFFNGELGTTLEVKTYFTISESQLVLHTEECPTMTFYNLQYYFPDVHGKDLNTWTDGGINLRGTEYLCSVCSPAELKKMSLEQQKTYCWAVSIIDMYDTDGHCIGNVIDCERMDTYGKPNSVVVRYSR